MWDRTRAKTRETVGLNGSVGCIDPRHGIVVRAPGGHTDALGRARIGDPPGTPRHRRALFGCDAGQSVDAIHYGVGDDTEQGPNPHSNRHARPATDKDADCCPKTGTDSDAQVVARPAGHVDSGTDCHRVLVTGCVELLLEVDAMTVASGGPSGPTARTPLLGTRLSAGRGCTDSSRSHSLG